jgi:hypothetical protein
MKEEKKFREELMAYFPLTILFDTTRTLKKTPRAATYEFNVTRHPKAEWSNV